MHCRGLKLDVEGVVLVGAVTWDLCPVFELDLWHAVAGAVVESVQLGKVVRIQRKVKHSNVGLWHTSVIAGAQESNAHTRMRSGVMLLGMAATPRWT